MSTPQRFDVTVADRHYTVTVELDDDGQPQRVEVGDVPCSVELGVDDMMLVHSPDRDQYAVQLSPGRDPQQAAIGSMVFDIKADIARASSPARAAPTQDHRNILAPMPGQVIRVLVREGDVVERDTPVLIVEAMKMENEIRVLTAGTIRQIAVAEGDIVESGQRLVEVDPQEPPPSAAPTP